VAQRIEVIGILIAAGDRQDPGAQYPVQAMGDAALITRISDAAGKLCGDTQLALCLGEQKHAAVRSQPPAIEGRRDFPAMNGWKREWEKAIVCHGDRGSICPAQRIGVSNPSLS